MIAIADVDKIKGLFKRKFPSKTVFKIGKYKNGYLVIASETNDDYNDPYYFVSGTSITQFSPMTDFAGVNAAFSKYKVYDNGEA